MTFPADDRPNRGLSRRTLFRGAGVAAGAVAVGGLPTPASAATPTAPETLKLARVWFRKDQQALLADFDDTHNVFADGSIEVLLAPGDLARLKATGLRFTVTVPDLVARDAALARAAGSRSLTLAAQPGERTGYRQLADYEKDMRALVEAHPTKARLLELPTKTLEGRTVYGIEIATDVANNDGRPVFYNDGCHHAREWPAAEVPIMWAYDLLENYGTDPRITALVDNTRNIIVPVVNVDGFEYSRTHPMTAVENGTTNVAINQVFGIATQGSYWRKNRRNLTGQQVGASVGRITVLDQDKPNVDAYGIDPNRNYSYAWGDDLGGSSSSKESGTYRGTTPFSEAESSNVAHVLKTHQVTAMISHHTSGNLVLWAWGDTTDDAPDNTLLEGIGRWTATFNGYKPQKSIQLYVTTGTCSDYAYGVLGSIGYTFEHAGSTFHPPYATTVPAMYAKNREALILLAEEMCLVPALRPARTDVPAQVTDVEYRTGVLNHAILTGRVVGAKNEPATVILRKRFQTLLWKDGDGGNPSGMKSVEEVIETSMQTEPDGRFVYHVNPSTRPYLTAAGQSETYELVIKSADGTAGLARDLLVERGREIDLGTLRLS